MLGPNTIAVLQKPVICVTREQEKHVVPEVGSVVTCKVGTNMTVVVSCHNLIMITVFQSCFEPVFKVKPGVNFFFLTESSATCKLNQGLQLNP